MKRLIFQAILLTLVFGFLGSVEATPAATSDPWEEKVDPWVLTNTQGGEAEFLVLMADQADLRPAAALGSKLEKGAFVYETLSGLAESTQGPIRGVLDSLGVTYRSYWVANMLWVRGNSQIVQQIAQRADVARIHANPWVRLALPSDAPGGSHPQTVAGIEWNISQINVPAVWGQGYTGQGIVIAGQDTGYDWDHPALKDQYRGWDGASADHNFNWHDAIKSGGGSCGPNTAAPCDDQGHGTHTMGTMVGVEGDYQVGVAPGAKWIGCRNMNVGAGTPATYAECYQWFIAPTDLNGQNPDPAKAPHVINNSWGCPTSEGCTDPNVLLLVVQAVRAAGIVTVHSAGNSGSGCNTVNTPAAIYDESFSVGATDSSDNIASFSSRGPVTVDGSNRLKPDVSAPGVNIRSCLNGGGYTTKQGTSMAGPHVAGLVALLLSARPGLIGQVDEIEAIITQSALPRTTTQNCGLIPGSQVPNHTYGWGRIDAWAALHEALYFVFLPWFVK